ncbi:uncharacterized protein TNCV_4161911 [Trichonephila clavipes]|nr:uncharacterized protein TNCV_4161911 [Trichonephila clavipes]
MLAKNFKKYFLNEDSLVASYEWIRDLFRDTPEGLSTSEEEIFIDLTSSEKLKGNLVEARQDEDFSCAYGSKYAVSGLVLHSLRNSALEIKCINCSQLHSADSKLCPKWKTEKQIPEIKTNENISYFEARKLIVPQLTQTYAQAIKPSTISTTTQTDPNITNIFCPPLQCLKPYLLQIRCLVPRFQCLPSPRLIFIYSSAIIPTAIIPTIQKTKTCSLTTPNKFNALSTETLPESVPTTCNSEHSDAPKIPQWVKRTSRNRRKRPKVQKPEIEIKMAPHRPKRSALTEYATDEKDMITYDVEEQELEKYPTDKFTIKEGPTNFPKGY